MIRVGGIALVPALLACACHSGTFAERYTVGDELVVRDFERKVRIYGTALLPAPGGGSLSIWSDDEGVWSLVLDEDGKALREPVRVSKLGAAMLAALSVGGECERSGVSFALVAAPRASVTGGNEALEVLLLGHDGRRTGTVLLEDMVGPYTRQVSVAGGCDGLIVGWHRGSIGDFSARVALIDPLAGEVKWERRLSDEGASGFCPGLLVGEGRFIVVWGQVEPGFRPRSSDPVPDSLMFAAFDAGGATVSGPRRLMDTFRPASAPALVWHGERIAMAFRDHQQDTHREGIYLAFVDREGGLVGEPERIGRGDGPDAPLLVSLPGERLVTAVIRSLAFELLVGVNYLDARGGKLAGEVQIYAHQVKFRHLSSRLRREEILLQHVEQGRTRTRILVTPLAPSRR